ncbi:HlyD family efflux transporter periplasmic adaptor subunit [Acinetobacter baumannii]|nr:HlyD family efflux transporter periplasmic adaptor subunit [Acinetobacter baumannii]MDX7929032.1 HlyD family efflux transporter periplasmic adaptor subunit [Acinetobacter baumannii]
MNDLKKMLFREKAANSKKNENKQYGEIIVYFPKKYMLLTFVFMLIVISILCLIFFTNYKKKVNVSGELVSKNGVVPVYLPKSGFVLKTFLVDGDDVKKNQPILEISNENFNYAGLNKSIEIDYKNNMKILDKLKNDTNMSFEVKIKQSEKEISLIREEIKSLNKQLNILIDKNKLLRDELTAFKNSEFVTAISKSEMNAKINEELDSKMKIIELEQNKIRLKKDLNQEIGKLNSYSLELSEQLNRIDKEKNDLSLQRNEKSSFQSILVKTPIEGNIGALQIKSGMYYNNNKPIAIIVPKNSLIEAVLLVPSNSIGFIKKGDKVLLKYAAYPYQQFGQGEGEIYHISSTSLSPDELTLSNRQDVKEPMYLVKVSIRKQNLYLNHIKYILKPGIKVEASVILEEKPIINWIVDPIMNVIN